MAHDANFHHSHTPVQLPSNIAINPTPAPNSVYMQPQPSAPAMYGHPNVQTVYTNSQPIPQMGYGQPQMGYGQPQMGYRPQMGYGQPQMGYGQPQMLYGQQPIMMGQPVPQPYMMQAAPTPPPQIQIITTKQTEPEKPQNLHGHRHTVPQPVIVQQPAPQPVIVQEQRPPVIVQTSPSKYKSTTKYQIAHYNQPRYQRPPHYRQPPPPPQRQYYQTQTKTKHVRHYRAKTVNKRVHIKHNTHVQQKWQTTHIRPAIYDWGGLYGGAHIAIGAFTGSDPDIGGDGILVGFQFGHNFQFDKFVVGIETDFSLGNISGSNSNAAAHFKTNNLFTLRARGGYAFGPTLLYATLGLGLAHGEGTRTTTGASDKNTHFGIVFGLGVEHAVHTDWSVKLEYLYGAFNDKEYDANVNDFGFDEHIVRIGFNWHFNPSSWK